MAAARRPPYIWGLYASGRSVSRTEPYRTGLQTPSDPSQDETKLPAEGRLFAMTHGVGKTDRATEMTFCCKAAANLNQRTLRDVHVDLPKRKS